MIFVFTILHLQYDCQHIIFVMYTGSSSYNKPPVSLLKKTGESFLQDDSCSEVTPKLMKCRECKMTPTQRSKKLPNIFCRFYAFRR